MYAHVYTLPLLGSRYDLEKFHHAMLLPGFRNRRKNQRAIFTPRAFQDNNKTPNQPQNSPIAAPDKKAYVDHVRFVCEELQKKDRIVIAQIAPAVRVSIGEEFGMPPGTLCTGKLVSALRLLGFDYVFDIVAAADITIIEEGHELIHRLRDNLQGAANAPPIPMFTSCCPGWIEWIEKCAPDLIPHVSTAMSPQMMGGSLIKEFFSEVIGKKDTDISMVSIMPCVRKQGEADRISFQTKHGARHVDHVLTTKDIALLLKEKGIDFASLPDSHFDDYLGISTGSGSLFGTTGGVTEAALRTVVELAGGKQLDKIEFRGVRGLDGVKEATVTLPANPQGPLHNTAPIDLHVAVANGLGNAKKLMKDVEAGTSPYHFIEVMACPGGCIGGGGQPRTKDKDALKMRQAGLYSADERSTIRKSHENPSVKKIYERWLGEPGSEKAEEVLHTRFVECGPGKFDIMSMVRKEDACDLPGEEECDQDVCETSSSGSEIDS